MDGTGPEGDLATGWSIQMTLSDGDNYTISASNGQTIEIVPTQGNKNVLMVKSADIKLSSVPVTVTVHKDGNDTTGSTLMPPIYLYYAAPSGVIGVCPVRQP